MEPSSEEKYVLWDRLQNVNKARKRLERRELIKNFALVLSLVGLTLVAATVLAH